MGQTMGAAELGDAGGPLLVAGATSAATLTAGYAILAALTAAPAASNAPPHSGPTTHDVDDALQLAVVVGAGARSRVDRDRARPELVGAGTVMGDRGGPVHAGRPTSGYICEGGRKHVTLSALANTVERAVGARPTATRTGAVE